MLITTVT